MKTQEIIDALIVIHQDCASMLKQADLLAKTSSPKLRALAYEIGISVAGLTAAGKEAIKEAETLAAETGAMAD